MCHQNDVITTTARDISFTTRKQQTKNMTHLVCIMQLIMLHITFSLARTLPVSHASDIQLLPDLVEQENLVKVRSLQWLLWLAGWMHDSSYLLSVILAVSQQENFEYMAPLLGLFDYGLPISSIYDYELKLLGPSRSVYTTALQMDSLGSRIWTVSPGTKV